MTSRALSGVADWRDVEPQHHRVVLVDRVVAMHRVLPGEIAKAEEERGAGIRFQSEHVLAAGLDQRRRGRSPAIDRQGLELLEVDVDRMFPLATVVDQRPLLHGILLDREADVVTGEEPFVDLPAATAVGEDERSFDPGRNRRARQIVELGDRCRVLAVVGHRGTVDDDLED